MRRSAQSELCVPCACMEPGLNTGCSCQVDWLLDSTGCSGCPCEGDQTAPDIIVDVTMLCCMVASCHLCFMVVLAEQPQARPPCTAATARMRHCFPQLGQRPPQPGAPLSNCAFMPAQALLHYDAACTSGGGSMAAFNNRAMTHLKLGHLDLAEADCDRVLSQEPHNPKALLRRASAR